MIEAKPERKKPVPWQEVITSIQENALIALGRHMYLTLSQLLDLNVGTTQYTYLWKQMASLRDRRIPLVNCTTFSIPEPKKGRVESLYSLSHHGKKILISDFGVKEEELKAPVGGFVAYKDYHHRKSTIDFQISLEKWCAQSNVPLFNFETYFDKTGNNRTDKNLRARTRVDLGQDFIVPDAVFKLLGKKEVELFLFEMHNGKDSKRMLRQLHNHAAAMVSRAVHKKYGYDLDKSYRILCLFEFSSTLKCVIERAREEKSLSRIEKFFLLKSLEGQQGSNFWEEWRTLYGNPFDDFDLIF